jgi:signal transduction histidine kinase
MRQLLLRLRHGRGVWRDFEVVTANRLHDPSIEGFVLNMRDITERLQIEHLGERLEAQRVRQDLERRLQRAQRLESVGQLAGGVAHDFNNLLAAILNTASLVREDLEPASPLQDDLAEIEDVARRGARLVRQLLLFSQRKPTTPEVLDLNAVIGDLDRLMRRSLGSQVRLGVDLDPQLAPVEADLSNVEQVLVNLLVNARDALGDGGTVTVETANVEVVPEAAVDLEVEPGWYVRLSVVDDGAGMDAATLERAVEPFFTTKDPGKGTGLGLATVLGVADQAGGTVSLESEPGGGTSVLVYLPAATPAG